MSSTDFFHGITVSLVETGARTISLPSSSIIGIVDTFTPGLGLVASNVPTLLTRESEAVAAFGPDSAITRACKAIFNQSAAAIVAVGVPADTELAVLTSALIGGVTADGRRTGMQALLDGKSLFNLQPRLLITPKHSSIEAVASAMDVLAGKLKAIGIIDGPNTTDEAAIEYAEKFGTKRLFMVDPAVKQWSTTANADVFVPGSAIAAGLFAQTDSRFGFWASPSNKEIAGITGTARPVEYLDGDKTCRANLLNGAHITTIIRDGGYRLWGNRTLSPDAKWSFVTRVRTTDMVMEAIQAGMKWAVDRGITKTYVKDVTETVNAFMRDLKAQGAVINFEVYPDLEKTTATQIEQGKLYWTVRFTDVPPAENPIFQIEVTNQFLSEVLEA